MWETVALRGPYFERQRGVLHHEVQTENQLFLVNELEETVKGTMGTMIAGFGKTKFREIQQDFNEHKDVLFQPKDSSARVFLESAYTTYGAAVNSMKRSKGSDKPGSCIILW